MALIISKIALSFFILDQVTNIVHLLDVVLFVQMGSLGLVGKLKLENVTQQLNYRVIQSQNWFLTLQVVAYYLQALLEGAYAIVT